MLYIMLSSFDFDLVITSFYNVHCSFICVFLPFIYWFYFYRWRRL